MFNLSSCVGLFNTARYTLNTYLVDKKTKLKIRGWCHASIDTKKVFSRVTIWFFFNIFLFEILEFCKINLFLGRILICIMIMWMLVKTTSILLAIKIHVHPSAVVMSCSYMYFYSYCRARIFQWQSMRKYNKMLIFLNYKLQKVYVNIIYISW